MNKLDAIKRQLSRMKKERRFALRQAKQERKELESIDEEIQHVKQAQDVIQHVAQAVQQKAHNRIAAIVTRCLQAVFDEPYEFKIEFERKRGKTEAKVVFIRNGMEIRDRIQDSIGGGVIDVAAFALRLARLMLSKPQPRRLLLLDEPFKNPDNSLRARVRSLLESLSSEMDMQIIMVTHIPELTVGKVIEIGE